MSSSIAEPLTTIAGGGGSSSVDSAPQESTTAEPPEYDGQSLRSRSTTPFPSRSANSFFYDESAVSCAPSYTSFPLADEETVEFTPRPGLSSFTGTFTKEWKSMVLTLQRQPNDVQNPIYDRSGLVVGELEMKNPGRVLAVSVKLEGRVTMVVTGVGATVTRTVEDEPMMLWEKEEGSQECCPGILLVSLRLPAAFVDNGELWKLPPSFEPTFLDIASTFVRSTYTLSISISRVVNYRLVSWVKHKTYNVLLDHIPQSRPSRPIPYFDSIFGSVKSVPDEWAQLTSKMEVTPGSRLQPVECHFFIPSNPTYCLSEAIPYHIQMSSSLGTLQELFPPSSYVLQPEHAEETERKGMRGQFSLRVYIARDITVKIRGKRGSRTAVVGTGTLRAVPPTDLGGKSVPSENVCLDWEGEVKCRPEVKSGGFEVGCLNIKDYIVFALTPPLDKSEEVVGLQVAHPVRFVTDPWVENGTVHPGDADAQARALVGGFEEV